MVGSLALAAVGGWIGSLYLPDEPAKYQSYWYPAAGGATGVALGLLFVFGLILLWNLIWAPYRQRNEARSHIRELEDEAARSKSPPSFTWIAQPVDGIDNYYAHITVTNRGGSTAEGCLMQLEDIRRPNKGQASEFSPFILRWDGHQGKEKEIQKPIQPMRSVTAVLCAAPKKSWDGWYEEQWAQFKIPFGVRITPATDAYPVGNLRYAPGIYHMKLRVVGDNIGKNIEGSEEIVIIKVGDTPETLEVEVNPYKGVL